MLALYLPAFVVALLITVLEMTEVVALVFAIGAGAASVRSGALGAVSGTALVGGIAVVSGAALVALPRAPLLGSAAVVLAAFGVVLFRSTLRAYRRARAPGGAPSHPAGLQFAGGFSVGVVETVEAVIVLLALAAAGYGSSAVLGAIAGGVLLVAVAAALHGRIRRIKVPPLKLTATALLFTFAVFWTGEGLGVPWPDGDLVLLPLFAAALLLVRAGIAVAEGRGRLPVEPKG